MTIAYLLRILWSWRLFIILSGAACCAIATAIASTVQPLYQSVARVELEMARPDPVTGRTIDPKYVSAYVATQAELIGDYGVAGRAADAGGFTNSAEMAAQYRQSGADDRMDFRRWIAQFVINSTSVGLEEEGNVLEIRYIAGTPEAAVGMAELVRTAYIDEVVATQRSGAVENATWFADQAQATRDRLAAAEAEMRDFQRETGIVLASRDTTMDERRLDILARNIPPTSRGNANGQEAGPTERALAEVQQQLAASSQTLGPNHPRMIRLREQEKVLKAAVEEAAAQRSSPDSGSGNQAALEAGKERAIARSDQADELRRMATNVDLLREQYERLSARAIGTDQLAESRNVGLTPLGPASTPIKPLFPNFKLVIPLAFGFGLAWGVMTALLIEFLGMKVRHADDLKVAAVPVFRPRDKTPPPNDTTPVTSWWARLWRGRTATDNTHLTA